MAESGVAGAVPAGADPARGRPGGDAGRVAAQPDARRRRPVAARRWPNITRLGSVVSGRAARAAGGRGRRAVGRPGGGGALRSAAGGRDAGPAVEAAPPAGRGTGWARRRAGRDAGEAAPARPGARRVGRGTCAPGRLARAGPRAARSTGTATRRRGSWSPVGSKLRFSGASRTTAAVRPWLAGRRRPVARGPRNGRRSCPSPRSGATRSGTGRASPRSGCWRRRRWARPGGAPPSRARSPSKPGVLSSAPGCGASFGHLAELIELSGAASGRAGRPMPTGRCASPSRRQLTWLSNAAAGRAAARPRTALVGEGRRRTGRGAGHRRAAVRRRHRPRQRRRAGAPGRPARRRARRRDRRAAGAGAVRPRGTAPGRARGGSSGTVRLNRLHGRRDSTGRTAASSSTPRAP